MTNKTPWIILLVLWMGGSTWWHVCRIKQVCPDIGGTGQAASSNEPVRVPALRIADGDRFEFNLPGNFSFAKSGEHANINTLGGSLDSLTGYLKTTGRTLEITGYYTSDETNSTQFANLGLARAEGVRQYLIQQGIQAASVTTKGAEKNDLSFNARGDSLYGGLGIAFLDAGPSPAPTAEKPKADTSESVTTTDLTVTTPPALETVAAGITEEGLAEAEKFTSVFESIDLYFPLSEANYIKTPDTRKFFEEATKYLADHKDKKLIVTGHTDNTGPEDANRRLSRERAAQVKAKLRQSGIDGDQIIVDAKGEDEPKASNDTREGRKANRRVTVVVK